MPLNNPRPGYSNAAEYTVSGVPWVLSGSAPATSATVHEFDYVSRAVTVANNSAAGSYLLVGFTRNGVSGSSNCFPLDGGKSQRFEVRVRDLWLKGQNSTVNYAVLAELTTIERKNMLPLTGSASSDAIASSSIIWRGVG